jgi:methionine transaminase
MQMEIASKLPNVGTSIFSVMSQMSAQYGAVNLSQGFPNFDCSPILQQLAQEAVATGNNQYAPLGGLPALTAQIAAKTWQLYGKTLNPHAEITVTSGATQAIFTAIQAFVRHGDKVLLIEPAYDSYRPAVELCGGTVVSYRLPSPDFRIDWDEFGKKITDDLRLIIVNTPHNPTGTIWTQEDWQQLARLVEGKNLVIISDEVYEHIVFEGQPHESILRYPELWKRTFAVSSFGKTFHTTGWKVGYCIAPEGLMSEFRKVHQFTVFSVSTPMQWALAKFCEDANNYLQLSDFYQKKRDLFLKTLKNTRFHALPCAGTYFQLVDYSAISDKNDVDFAIEMTQQHGVAVIPITPFCSAPFEDKIVRVCFAKTDEVLHAAGKLLAVI